MQLDVQNLSQPELYKLLTGCIIPRPIAWVSTIDTNGVPNLAPFSFFNGVGSNPPAVSIAVGATESQDGRKDTLRNIQTTSEFVVNIVNEPLAEAMNETAINYPSTINEFEAAGLTMASCVIVQPPRVAEAPVSMECHLYTTVPVGEGPGSSTLVVGTIATIHVRDDIINERLHIDVQRLQPIGRLAGPSYAFVRETFDMQRARYNSETDEVERS